MNAEPRMPRSLSPHARRPWPHQCRREDARVAVDRRPRRARRPPRRTGGLNGEPRGHRCWSPVEGGPAVLSDTVCGPQSESRHSLQPRRRQRGLRVRHRAASMEAADRADRRLDNCANTNERGSPAPFHNGDVGSGSRPGPRTSLGSGRTPRGRRIPLRGASTRVDAAPSGPGPSWRQSRFRYCGHAALTTSIAGPKTRL